MITANLVLRNIPPDFDDFKNVQNQLRINAIVKREMDKLAQQMLDNAMLHGQSVLKIDAEKAKNIPYGQFYLGINTNNVA